LVQAGSPKDCLELDLLAIADLEAVCHEQMRGQYSNQYAERAGRVSSRHGVTRKHARQSVAKGLTGGAYP
jgi:hypothetical protein